MLRTRSLLHGSAALAVALAGVLAGCELSTQFDRGLIAVDDGGSDATLDAPPGSDGAGNDAAGGDGAGGDGAGGDGAGSDSATDADAGTKDAATDGGADAPADANGFDVVVDGAGFLDGAGDDGGLCTTLANGAPQVQQVDVAAARPVATGGSFVDGTYFKTSDKVYTGAGGATGPTGYTVRETIAITNSSTGTALLLSTFIDNGGTTTERITVSPTTSGGAITLTFVCPAFGPSSTSFNTRTGDAGQIELDIYLSTDRIETFTRQ